MRLLLAVSLAGAFVLALPAAPSEPVAVQYAAALPLPAPGPLARKRAAIRGPRAAWMVAAQRSRAGRRIPVHFFGNGRARSTLLVAGCANGRRCAGQQVVAAAQYECPPDDAELWIMSTLRPEGADLDTRSRGPGAAAYRQAVADLRPRLAVVYRTGPRAVVRADGAGLAAARRYARLTGLPFAADGGSRRAVEHAADGAGGGGSLAAWTQAARPRGAAFTVELPAVRLTRLVAARHGNALLHLVGTRFARPASFRLVRRAPRDAICPGPAYLIRFAEAGRAFEIHVALRGPQSEWRRRQVREVLDAMRVRP